MKQEKAGWVAVAPTSASTTDGNADRMGILSGLHSDFSGWVAENSTEKADRLLCE